MTGNKSYADIVSSCELIDFVDKADTRERWTDGEYIYTCIWLPKAQGTMPTTIYKEAL